ncbi:MAG: hypothetical protein ACLPKE_33930 [Streptosporangiaceae bacterium]
MILGVLAVVMVALLITSLAQRRHRASRRPGPVLSQRFPSRQRSPRWRSTPRRSARRRSARQRAAAPRRLRPDQERLLAELDATWEPGYADRVAALLPPDADVDLPPQ